MTPFAVAQAHWWELYWLAGVDAVGSAADWGPATAARVAVGLLALLLLRFGMKAARGPGTASAPASRRLGLLRRDLFLHTAALVVGFLTASYLIDAVDQRLQTNIQKAASKVLDARLGKAAARWKIRSERLLALLTGKSEEGGSLRLRPTPDRPVGDGLAAPWVPPETWKAWRIVHDLLVKTPEKRAELLAKLNAYWRSRDEKSTDVKPKDEALSAFVLTNTDAALLDDDRLRTIARNVTDLEDLSAFVDVAEKSVVRKKAVAEYTAHGWSPNGTSLRVAIEGVYDDVSPASPFGDGSAERRLQRLRQRVGTTYRKPIAKDFVRAIRDVLAASTEPTPPDRVVAIAVASMLVPDDRLENRIIPPQEYELTGVRVGKALETKYYEYIQNELVEAIDKSSIQTTNAEGTTRRVPFRLDVTDQDLRAMLRGPVQLCTFTAFFAAMFLLLVKGLVLTVCEQYALFWSKVWTYAPDRPDLLRSYAHAFADVGDLIPEMFTAAFDRWLAGGSVQAVVRASKRAGRRWEDTRSREFTILDYVEYLLPALGFVGTLLGNGQGLGQANRVMIPGSQAESLSDMTTHLGQSFYATLIALACSIVYLFFRSLLGRVQAGLVSYAQAAVGRHLRSHFTRAG